MTTAERWKRGPKEVTDSLRRFHRTVRVLRLKKGLSVAELSEQAGVTEYLIRRIESGKPVDVLASKMYQLAFVLAGGFPEFARIAAQGRSAKRVKGRGKK
jgi:transcriptional regulator with XRE-family HTH domain